MGAANSVPEKISNPCAKWSMPERAMLIWLEISSSIVSSETTGPGWKKRKKERKKERKKSTSCMNIIIFFFSHLFITCMLVWGERFLQSGAVLAIKVQSMMQSSSPLHWLTHVGVASLQSDGQVSTLSSQSQLWSPHTVLQKKYNEHKKIIIHVNMHSLFSLCKKKIYIVNTYLNWNSRNLILQNYY